MGPLELNIIEQKLMVVARGESGVGGGGWGANYNRVDIANHYFMRKSCAVQPQIDMANKIP